MWISEILFNPPGTDAPREYIELRGTPNQVLPAGTYLVVVDGDANNDPGTIQNVFDLSGQRLGGNGYLVLLQSGHNYAVSASATVLQNVNSPGFGSGSSSTVRHRGRNGQTDMENASVTFFLIQSSQEPAPDDDIDSNDNGVPNGALFDSWTIHDSVAILDNDGDGDFGYGQINFRRDAPPGSQATVDSGTVVSIPFTANYVARAGNTTTWEASAWIASGSLVGNAPNWSLNGVETVPALYSGMALNHIGLPNFGAAPQAGVVITESGGSTDLTEGAGSDTYTISLNTPPAGTVTVRVTAPASLQVSTNGGTTYGSSYNVAFNSTAARTITVRALNDNFVGSWSPAPRITNAIVSSSDSAYPVSALVPNVAVNVMDNETLLISEVKVNPPGTDHPYEFIELSGTPNAVLTNIYFVALTGDSEADPGRTAAAVNLTGVQMGSSGLLMIVGDGHPYTIPVGTRVVLTSQLSANGGALPNGSVSLLLLNAPSAIALDDDLDGGDNGVAEDLPAGTVFLDSLAWSDGGNNDVLYTWAVLTQGAGTPDAATRLPGQTAANSAAAWINADLLGPNPASLEYESTGGSTNFPYGTRLTVGTANTLAPVVTPMQPFSSVIGDPTTPLLHISVSHPNTLPHLFSITATSSHPAVVPNSNLILSGTGATRTLAIHPVGVGYAMITIIVQANGMTGWHRFPYAASIDPLGTGIHHTGVSDASTAMSIDSRYMFVGDDENQILRLFSRSNSGPAIATFDMVPFLGLDDFYPDGTPREVDIEGTTRVGNRIFWLGSHSHSRDANLRTNRSRLFGTDATFNGTNSTLTFVGRYDYLKMDLLAWDVLNGHGKGPGYYGLTQSSDPGIDPKAPDGSGFNFEGLTMAPGSSTVAYLAMRAPLVPPTNRVNALIIPVTNFPALAVCNATEPGVSQFGQPIELNLGGRAIRSIEGNSNGFLIVAGPPGLANGQPPTDFRLFKWNGLPGSQPQELSTVLPVELLPEGIVELPPGPWTSESEVQLVSDCGIFVYYNDDVQAKFLPIRPFKKFRSDWVKLGSVVATQPVIRNVQYSATSCLLTWFSIAGTTYRVQTKSSLAEATWTNVAGDVTATGSLSSKTISISGASQKFFRVIIP